MSWCPGQMPDRGRVGPAFCRDRCRLRHLSRVLCVCLRAMLLDGTPPLGGGYRSHKHGYWPGCTHAHHHRPQWHHLVQRRCAWCWHASCSHPPWGGQQPSPHRLHAPTCRGRLRRLDLSHYRDRRGPYGTSARLASSTGSARAVTGPTEHPACPLPARSADTAASRRACGRSATAPLEAVHADVCHAGMPGHGLAARCHHRVSCRLPHRADTAQAPAAIARAGIVWARRWSCSHCRGQTSRGGQRHCCMRVFLPSS